MFSDADKKWLSTIVDLVKSVFFRHTHVLSHKHTNTHLQSVHFTLQQSLFHNKVAQIGSYYRSGRHVDVCASITAYEAFQSVTVLLQPAAWGLGCVHHRRARGGGVQRHLWRGLTMHTNTSSRWNRALMPRFHLYQHKCQNLHRDTWPEANC